MVTFERRRRRASPAVRRFFTPTPFALAFDGGSTTYDTLAHVGAIRFNDVDSLADRAGLSSLLGPVREIERSPLASAGYSGSALERLDVALDSGVRILLVLKRVRLDRDWTAFRSGDAIGREACLLDEPRLAGI